MTNRMTTEQLEAIRERAEKAAEGPWEFDGVGYCGEYPYIIDLTVGEVGVRYHAEDAEFISKARTDIPALLAEVESLNAEIADRETSHIELYNENKRLRSAIDSVMYDLHNEDCSDDFVVSQIVAELLQILGGDTE